mgnify:CR=1 FL=1
MNALPGDARDAAYHATTSRRANICASSPTSLVTRHCGKLSETVAHNSLSSAADQAPPARRDRWCCVINRPKPCFKLNNRLRHAVFKKARAAFVFNIPLARSHNRIGGHRKRQFVDNHARQLFAAHINTLPKTRRGKQHRVRRLPETLQQPALRSTTLQETRDTRSQALARSYSDCIPARLVESTNARPSVAFTIFDRLPLRAASAHSRERGSGIFGRQIQQRLSFDSRRLIQQSGRRPSSVPAARE